MKPAEHIIWENTSRWSKRLPHASLSKTPPDGKPLWFAMIVVSSMDLSLDIVRSTRGFKHYAKNVATAGRRTQLVITSSVDVEAKFTQATGVRDFHNHLPLASCKTI